MERKVSNYLAIKPVLVKVTSYNQLVADFCKVFKQYLPPKNRWQYIKLTHTVEYNILYNNYQMFLRKILKLKIKNSDQL